MWEPTPWVVGGGAEHSPEVARLLAYVASSSAEGIVTSGDLKVSALPVAAESIRVAPGAALIRNRFAGGGQQTYAVRNTAAHDAPVVATDSGGGRSDLVVARIHDPQYAGEIPTDPTDYQYVRTEVIQGVPSGTTSALDLNLGYPAIALARLDIPASTATITDSMIADLREVAQPRTKRHLFTYALTAEDEPDWLNWPTGAPPDGEAWPNYFWHVDIPEWAQRVRIRAFWAQVRVEQKTPNNYGHLWVRIGTVANGFSSQHVNWDIATTGGITRQAWMVADDRSVPSAFRGTRQQVYLRGYLNNDNGNVPKLDMQSAISVDLEFYETAV